MLTEENAGIVADALGGEAWDSGGGIWLIRLERPDGKLVVISDEIVCEYENEAAFEQAAAAISIILH
jgi:hypothetical protein